MRLLAFAAILSMQPWAPLVASEKLPIYKSRAECETLPPPQIGMTPIEVVNGKWGRPWDVKETITADKYSTQWVYLGADECLHVMDHTAMRFLYFVNGRLVAIQR